MLSKPVTSRARAEPDSWDTERTADKLPNEYHRLSDPQILPVIRPTWQLELNRSWQELLQRVGLEGRADERVKTYSLGMKQRLGIAQSMLGNGFFAILYDRF
ncbi:hypothetical protein DOE73_14750 [Paenibacillus dendritiformis]|nr:hypothetical protein DOE73_14750 [Paenibacillus dendritiformis]